MAKGNKNLNLVRKIVREHGGEVVSERTGMKHIVVQIRTASGKEVSMTVMLGKTDPMKLKGWVRQRLTNPSNQKGVTGKTF